LLSNREEGIMSMYRREFAFKKRICLVSVWVSLVEKRATCQGKMMKNKVRKGKDWYFEHANNKSK
jgi:hypothetical protein